MDRMDFVEEGEMLEAARRFANGETGLVDPEVVDMLLRQRDKALRLIDGWHQLWNHVDRIRVMPRGPQMADLHEWVQGDLDRIEEIRRST